MDIEIRGRRSGFLWVSNAFFDTYAKSLQPSALIVYLALARLVDNDMQTCFPSYETLAKMTGVCRSTVALALQELRDKGLIDWQMKGRHNRYSLLETTSPKNGLVRGDANDNQSDPSDSDQSDPSDPNKTQITRLNKTLSSPSVPTSEFQLQNPETNLPPKKQSSADPRHRRFMELISKAHQHFVKDLHGKGVVPLLGPAAGNNLRKLLTAQKGLTEITFRRWLTNYHGSQDHNPYNSPAQYIMKLPSYEGGSVNKFGRLEEEQGIAMLT